MAMIQFTGNVTDHSTENGYQFEFHCDKCGNGVMSSFIPSKASMASGFLRAASSLLGGGGVLGDAANASGYLRDQTRGKARDDALARAVEEARPQLRQCSRCGRWVCPQNCWNDSRGLCEDCAPDLTEETAAAQATAAREQVWEKARAADQLQGATITANRTATCPHCGAKASGGKFCAECGQPFSTKKHCTECGAEIEANSKFCAECGHKTG